MQKLLYSIWFVALFVVIVAACNKEQEAAIPLSISFDGIDDTVILDARSIKEIKYTIESDTDHITIEATPSSGITASVSVPVKVKENQYRGRVHIETGDIIPENSKVVLSVSNGKESISYALHVEYEVLKTDANTTINVGNSGGIISLDFYSNLNCTVLIPEMHKDWIEERKPDTKTVTSQALSVYVSPNPGLSRSAQITVVSKDDNHHGSIIYTILQDAGDVWKGDTTPPDNEIWYATADNAILSLTKSPFPGEMTFHVFHNGKGIIRSAGPINTITEEVFINQNKLSGIYLPETLTRIESGAFRFSGIREIVLPKSVLQIGASAFAGCQNLKRVVLNEGLEIIDMDCFSGNNLDCEIVFPSSLKYAGAYAFNSTGIKGFYGNPTFHTEDNKCFLESGAYGESSGLVILGRYIGGDADYSIPEGVQSIQNYAFDHLDDLTSVGFPSTLLGLSDIGFNECPNIKRIYGDCVSEDGKSIIVGDRYCLLFLSDGVKDFTVPEGIRDIANGAFARAQDLETIILPDSITSIGDYAFPCPQLRKIVFGSSLQQIGMGSWPPLGYLPSIEEIYFRSYIPPKEFGNLDIQNLEKLTVYVPEETLQQYKNAKQWTPWAAKMEAYKYNDLDEIQGYISSDYSADGSVQLLQKSASGNGINIILMGDAFSDRQIADGSYVHFMTSAMDAFFSEEPFASNRDLFNVYSVQVVSSTENYELDFPTPLGTSISIGGEENGGNYSAVIEYAKKAVQEYKLDDALVVVVMNKDNKSGITQIFCTPDGDYGRGLSIAYIPCLCDEETFKNLILHEAGGHGFAKLADEYSYGGQIDQSRINAILSETPYGRWKNIDFTSNPASVKWSQFIADPRYQNEGIGCYEGADGYLYGIWRPSATSIMRDLSDGFNAPSRLAIWYRINKLAFGTTWNGSYEDFVAADQTYRASALISNHPIYQKAKSTHLPSPILIERSKLH